MKYKKTLFLALIINAIIASTAQASLFDRGNGLIYDDISNLTIVSNANLFQTQASGNANLVNDIIAANNGVVHDTNNDYDTVPNSGTYSLSFYDFNTNSGQMHWWGAQAWIGYLNTIHYSGYDNWSLPTTIPATAGYSQTSSQMGELFYNELGGVAGSSITTTHNTNYNLFNNIQDYMYWSSSEYAPQLAHTWGFDWGSSINNGIQHGYFKDYLFYAWAVRSGDVTAVPVPGAVWLFGSVLLGLLSLKKRKSMGSPH